MTIIPIAWRDSETGPEFVLGPDDYEKVRQGYACSNCLEDYHGVWRPKCPACGCDSLQMFDLAPNDTSFVHTKRA